MIRINLLGDKVDNTVQYVLQGGTYVLSVMLTLGICFFIQGNVSEERQALKSDKKVLEKKLEELQKITKEVKGLEEKKGVLQQKLTTIANLKANKQGPVRILDDLNVSIPDRPWVVAVNARGDTLEVNGVALDNQTIAAFMQKLEESEFFGAVDLIHSTQYILNSVKLKQFSLAAEITNPYEVKPPPVMSKKATPGKTKKSRRKKKGAKKA